MSITWQDAFTVGIVVAAFGYVVRRILRRIWRKGISGCGCCTKCPPMPTEKPLVDLDQPTEK